ncbi:hypothetical protein LSH36_212g02001, partial [Paralvinella palmiformis]
ERRVRVWGSLAGTYLCLQLKDQTINYRTVVCPLVCQFRGASVGASAWFNLVFFCSRCPPSVCSIWSAAVRYTDHQIPGFLDRWPHIVPDSRDDVSRLQTAE